MTNKGWRQVVAYVAPSMSNRHSEKAGRKALCGQHEPAFSGLQFLAITRKPSFQSSWNRKLPNFDFWIFLKLFFDFLDFFSFFQQYIGSCNSCCCNMSYFYTFIFPLLERRRLSVQFYQIILKWYFLYNRIKIHL